MMIPSAIGWFAIRAALFLGLQAAILGLLFPFAFDPDNYMTAVVDKHARLDARAGEPRTILVGGSATAFGMDSQQIEERTGRRVTNLALHAGLGLPYILGEAAAVAQAGDQIWIAPEAHLFFHKPVLTSEIFVVVCARPQAAYEVPWVHYGGIVDSGLLSFAGHIVRSAANRLSVTPPRMDNLYKRSGFNMYGDFVGHENMRPRRPLGDISRDLPAYTEMVLRASVSVLAEAVRICQEKGADVWIVLPALHEEEFKVMEGRIARLISEFDVILKGRVVGRKAVAKPDQLFFDTVWHLTRGAAIERTDEILALMVEANRNPGVGTTW